MLFLNGQKWAKGESFTLVDDDCLVTLNQLFVLTFDDQQIKKSVASARQSYLI